MHRSFFNGWPLFGLLFSLQSAVLLATAVQQDLSQAERVSGLIALSVQVSVPCLYFAFAASAAALLFPGDASAWLRRNRRILGLAYAAGMGWQAFFILWLITFHLDYYNAVADNPYDLAEEIPGYLLLAAMTLTSFERTRHWLSPQRWRLLHTVGIYYLWGETWGTYWFYCYWYPDAKPVYHLYYWTGLLVFALRMAAMARRASRATRAAPA